MWTISAAVMHMRTSTTKNPHRTLILGSDVIASKFYQEWVKCGGVEQAKLIECKDLRKWMDGSPVSRIVVAGNALRTSRELADALIDCKLRGVKIENAVDSLERANRKIWLEGLSPEWLVLSNGFGLSTWCRAAKRIFDVTFALLLLLVTAPLMALTALAIKLDSVGPAVFRQERVGFMGRRFTVYKFRSMRLDAESNGPRWAAENDDRCTRVGSFLRRCRIDELPQIFNVLRGDMSFVGPRPERPYFVDLLNSRIRFYNLRHYAKPGITGWAQVMYPYGASIEDAYQKLQYDLYYAKNVSLRLDLLVLFKTVKVVFGREGR